jgi:biopolymer transport protein ExbD
VLDLLRDAGPLASVNVVVGVVAALLALVTLALSTRAGNAARVTSVLCLVFVLISVGLGFAGHALVMTSVDAAMGNVPPDQKLELLHRGTVEARANFQVALGCVALPLLAGVLASLLRRHALGLVFALAASGGVGALVYALTRPLPSTEPQLAMAPRLELPDSKSPRPLRVSVPFAFNRDGAWIDGVRSASLAQALDTLAAREPGSASATVIVDRNVTFAPFVELLQAMSARGWHAVQLVVQGAGGTRNVITVLDAPIEPGPNPMLLTLFIAPQSLEVGSGNNRLPSLPREWSALERQLADIKAAFPTHRFLRIGASPETTVADLVAALDAARPFEQLVVGAFELPVVRPELPPVGMRGEAIDVKAERPQVQDPSVDADALHRYVRARAAAVGACVERSGLRPKSVTITLRISPNGRALGVGSADAPAALERCLQDALGQWVFPFKPAADVRVVLPFTL